MIFLRKDEEYARLPDSGSQSGEKLGVLKVGFEHQLDRIIRIFEARFKTKTMSMRLFNNGEEKNSSD